ncbi:uncharacterized protein LOC127835062 [Dreissena polymorpha]|uniref:Uncharacterized protein n=1 Tax=Dreissena polymorpha TaxID=45954 RepID=A0A9D4G8U6_DREPO|nr:uncharacterized protein LOC127835062 [Dreissena polymorpha]KAH3812664.1 hypothetical protein DPMN_141101 [Dreissena polymorpha]
MCPSIPDMDSRPPFSVIGIAAGLSVFVPIACVAIFHILRVCRRRRRSATEVLVSGTSSSGSCDQADLPPSYSFLFGDTARSTREIEFRSQNSDTGQSNASLRASGTHLSSGTDSEAYSSIQRGATVQGIHKNQSVISLSPDALPAVPAAAEPGPRRQFEAGRSRFPNMHISILSRPESQESRDVTRPQTPDLSYARTPPPEYKDAVVTLGSGEINTKYIRDAKEREELH